MARRAIADFINADKNESGTLTADGAAPSLSVLALLTRSTEFARYFGLDSGLFLGRVVQAMNGNLDDGHIDVVEFLTGIAQFTSSAKEDKDHRVRLFAFHIMDLRDAGEVDVVRGLGQLRTSSLTRPSRRT